MAEPTSAAPLWTIRKTTTRKPRNAATISDLEIAWLLSGRGSPLKTAQGYDRRAKSSISNRRRGGVPGVARADREPPMPEAPILLVLAASAASPGAAGMPRGLDRDPIILGLSLIQRTALAARRAGYAEVFLLGGGDGKAPGIAAVADWTSLIASLSSAPASSLIIAPAAILAEGEWLERLASARIEPAGWGTIPNRIVMLRGRFGFGRGEGVGPGRRRPRLSRSRGPARFALWPARPYSCGDRSHDRRDAGRRRRRGTAASQVAGQGDRRVHGPPRRAADLVADFAPPGGNRDHAQSDEPDFGRGRGLWRAVFPVLAPGCCKPSGRSCFWRIRSSTAVTANWRGSNFSSRAGAESLIFGATTSCTRSFSAAWASAGAWPRAPSCRSRSAPAPCSGPWARPASSIGA